MQENFLSTLTLDPSSTTLSYLRKLIVSGNFPQSLMSKYVEPYLLQLHGLAQLLCSFVCEFEGLKGFDLKSWVETFYTHSCTPIISLWVFYNNTGEQLCEIRICNVILQMFTKEFFMLIYLKGILSEMN